MKAIITNKSSNNVSTSIGIVGVGKSLIFDIDSGGMYAMSYELHNLVKEGKLAINVVNNSEDRLKDMELWLRGNSETTQPMKLYVSVDGDDNNIGSVSSPFKTIQAALLRVPQHVKHPVEIIIGPGTFAGAWVPAYNFDYDGEMNNGPYLVISGSIAAPTITGLTSGTVASYTAASAASNYHSVVTVTGAGWTPGALRGKFFSASSGTGFSTYNNRRYVIVDNTSDTVTLADGETYNTTTNFVITEPATTLSGAIPFPLNPTIINGGGGTSANGFVFNPTNAGTVSNGCIFIQDINFSIGGYGCRVQCGTPITIQHCSFIDCSLAGVILWGTSGRHAILRSYFKTTGAGSAKGVWCVAAPVAVQCTSCVADKGGDFFVSDVAGITASVSKMNIKNSTGGAVKINQPGSGITISGIVDTCAYVTSMSQPSSITASDLKVSNCPVAFDVAVYGGYVSTSNITGTGNTVVAKVSGGGFIKWASTNTISGTTEVQLDGVSSTFATLRGTSPKVASNTIGSRVWEP